MDKGIVRQLVEVYYDVQDVRIRSFNRLRQVGEIEGVHPEILRQLESQIKHYIQLEIKGHPLSVWLRGIKGIGPILAGGLIGWIDIDKAEHISSLWKYCGLHVIQGKAVKREKGKKLGFNVRMRALCWKIADSFVKQRTPFYRDIYDKAKNEENEKLGNPLENPKNCPSFQECSSRLAKRAKRTKTEMKSLPCKKHIDSRARRKMVKRFLADLWLMWRKSEGLAVSEPYAIAILGHTPRHLSNPEWEKRAT